MIPVFQRTICRSTGDCFSACLASLLHLPLEVVPNFNLGRPGYQDIDIQAWLRDRGFSMLKVHYPEQTTERGIVLDYFHATGAYFIGSVPSQKFPGGRHAVVCQFQKDQNDESPHAGTYNRAIVHDPNPGNQPYPSDVELLCATFILPLELHRCLR